MSLSRLLLRNLLFHWRGNSAVLLGVVVGAAVLTGALLVGDSLRGSLRDLTLQRLGWVDQTLVAPRFFREELAEELGRAGGAERVAPALMLQATARRPGDVRGVRGVTVLGVDERFWDGFHEPRRPEKSAWLTRTVADALKVKEGDSVSLVLQKPSAIPRESLLGQRDDKNLVATWTVPVERVLSDADAADHFSLRPGLDAPRTAFVPLALLQKELKLDDRVNRVNAILVGGAKASLADDLRAKLDLDDWGLTLLGPDDRVRALFDRFGPAPTGGLHFSQWNGLLASSVVKAITQVNEAELKKAELTRNEVRDYYRRERAYLTLQSRQLFIEPAVVDAAEKAAKDNGLSFARSLVYLANAIDAAPHNAVGAATGYPTQRIPYSVIAAVDPSFLPGEFADLGDKQIVLARWPESPLHVKVGDEVIVRYFPPEHQGEPQEQSATFTVAGFVDLKGPTADPDITPEFPGITDKRGFDEWEDLPFPYDSWRVGERDKRYWSQYRTTPKAYVSLEAGQKLWGTRFGKVTSIRLTPKDGTDLSAAKKAFRESLRKELPPDRGGFVFDKVKADALAASSGGTDFAGLFLGFSFFLIAAALLLVGLLYRLNLDRRASEIGLLIATGYRRSKVRWLLLLEALILSGLGSLVGVGAGVLYARLLVSYLGWVWPGGTLQSFLRPHVDSAQSLAIGFAASLLVSVLTIFWATRVLGKIAPSALLAGRTTAEREPGLPSGPRWSRRVAPVSLVLGLGLLAVSPWVKGHEERAMTFFGSGALFLTACLAGVAWWMASSRHRTVDEGGWLGIARLGIRNAARHPARSLLTAGLLAAASFLLVAVEAFRRQPDESGSSVHSAGGGFVLLAESDQPVVTDLNTEEARLQLQGKLQQLYQEQPGVDAKAAERRAEEAVALLRQVKFYSFRVHAGDDASCLNLYQPRKPRVLGVPDSLVARGGFLFASAPPGRDPWEALERGGEPYPAFGEKNTVEWMLHSGEGKVYAVPDENGDLQPLRIDGLLQDSVFQSGLLVSDDTFRELYPHQEGYNFFLIDVQSQDPGKVKEILDTALADRGFEVTRTSDRLAEYLAVENTYLSTFQALGGLGLVLGSLGLAVVLLRGVWERRAELALLRALGYRRVTLGWLVLAENAFLLVLGLGAGTLSALAAVAPHVLSSDAAVPWRNLLLLLALVLIVGLAAGAAAVARTLRAPLIPALRRE
jgi:ABC-type antimicrobial peptide transport system permease subunit